MEREEVEVVGRILCMDREDGEGGSEFWKPRDEDVMMSTVHLQRRLDDAVSRADIDRVVDRCLRRYFLHLIVMMMMMERAQSQSQSRSQSLRSHSRCHHCGRGGRNNVSRDAREVVR